MGCGNGKWLRLLKGCGYRDLYGIDLFCDDNLVEGIHYKQSDIFNNSLKKYDLITFHHSFEHMENPEKVLRRVSELLSPNGLCIIRIPVMESEAWNRWETDMCLSEVIKNVKEYDLQMSEKLTNEVNRNGRGDQAVFYIKRI